MLINEFLLKSDEKFDLIVKLGTYGTIKLLFRWNKISGVYVVGGETQAGEPIFYGSTLYIGGDLLKNFRHKGVPKGTLGVIKNLNYTNTEVYPTPETILNYTLIYTE